MSDALDDWCSCRWVEADDFDGPEDHAEAVERCWVHGTESTDSGRPQSGGNRPTGVDSQLYVD